MFKTSRKKQETSRKQLWPVCWCSLYTLTADSCMTVSHFDIFQQCIWPAIDMMPNDCCSTWYRSTYISGEKHGLLLLASFLFDNSIVSVRLWVSMIFFLHQIDDKWQCDNSRITSAEDAILKVQSHHTRVLKGRSISTTTPNDSVSEEQILEMGSNQKTLQITNTWISIPGIKPSLSPVKLGQSQVFMWAVNVSTNHRDILGWTNMLYHVHGSSRRSTGPRWSYYSRGESQFESQQYFRGDLQTFPADWGDQNRYFNPNHDVF